MFSQSPPESICVVRLSAIGDTCHALAVVRSLQDAWPGSRITWLVGKTEASLMADINGVEFIIFDKHKGRGAYADVRAKLRGRKFDVALCMHASMRANLLCRQIKSRVRLGFDFDRARDFQWLFTNERIAAQRNQHVLDGMLGFARHIGAAKQALRWDIPLSDGDLAFASEHVSGGDPVLMISPCSSQRARNFRNWDAENYAAVARYTQEKYGCKVILTGASSELELEYGRTITNLVGQPLTNLIGQTSLKQLLALIATSAVVVCPDSGPAHMATTVGTSVIGLYATSNPDRSGPYLSRKLTVNAYAQAVERYLGKSVAQLRWGQRVRDPAAMQLIQVTDVNNKVDLVFGS